MLSDESYQLALYLYLGSAGVILLCLAWWLGRSWGAGWTLVLVLLAGALLLTPAYPNAAADTLAPALVVAGFQLFTEGPEAAGHALRPLGAACLAALVLAILLRLTVFRRRLVKASAETPEPGE
jgi:hypothetical protein